MAKTAKEHNEILKAMAEEHRKAELSMFNKGYVAGMRYAADLCADNNEVYNFKSTADAALLIRKKAAEELTRGFSK